MSASIALILALSAAWPQNPGGGWELRMVLNGEGGGEHFGYSVEPGPDYDQDGWPEILVGIPDRYRSALQGRPGGASLFHGRTGVPVWEFDSPYLSFPYGSANAVGWSVAFVPDLNSDGFSDVLVGDPGDSLSNNIWNTGRVYVLDGLYGSIIREQTGQPWVNGSEGDWTGYALLGIEDVDGDGAGDYVVGSPNSDLGQSSYYRRGLVTLYSGRTGVQLWSIGGLANYQWFGKFLALGPDLDSDGHHEILCGPSLLPESIWFVNPVTGTVVHSLPELVHSSGLRSFCWAVTCADLSGDGVEDVVGSSAAGASYNGAGMVTAWDTITKQVLWSYESTVAGEDFGHSLAALDDLDLDGIPEILAGVPTNYLHATNEGYAAVLSGGDGSILYRFSTRIDNAWRHTNYGFVVRGYGKDGRRDTALIEQLSLNDEEGIHVVQFQPYLAANRTAVSATNGASVVYQLDFPATEAGADYAILASASGRGPTMIGGLSVPLTADAVLASTLAGRYPVGFTQPRGSLDAHGQALATLQVSPRGLASYVGRTFYLAAVTGSGGVPRLTSIAVPLAILP